MSQLMSHGYDVTAVVYQVHFTHPPTLFFWVSPIYNLETLPHVAEIWQYVYVINSAASTDIWDNVASYDYTFWTAYGL